MEPIIDPIPVQLIEQELTSERLLRHTNKADNDIYVVTARSPSVPLAAAPARRVTSTSLT